MTLIYVIAGILVLIGLVISYVFVYRSGKAKGTLKSNNDCDKRILEIKTKLAKKMYGSVDNINAGLNIKLPMPKIETRNSKT